MKNVTIPKRTRLSKGTHNTYGDGACVMELVDWMDRRRKGKRVLKTAQLTDHPACVCPVIGAFLRSWNDSLSDADRNRLLLPLLPLTLDTADDAPKSPRAWMATDWLVRVFAPAWLDKAGLSGHALKLRNRSTIACTADAIAAQSDLSAAGSAARSAARSAASSAASSAAWSAARSAAEEALADTVAELQDSACDLVRRMCALSVDTA